MTAPVPAARNLAQVAREMLALQKRMGDLSRLAAQARSLPDVDGLSAAVACERARRILSRRYWDLAELLGVSVTSSAADIRRMTEQLQAVKRAYENS